MRCLFLLTRFLKSDFSHIISIINVAILGISGSTTMVTSLCLTAEFVKVNGFGGGSVYSTVTFIDKLASGGIVLIVQNLYDWNQIIDYNMYSDS